MITVMIVPLTPISQSFGIGYIFLALGLSVGYMAIKKQPKNNFNIRPDIKDECILIKDGIYAYIRHPMYFSVLVSMFGVLLLRFSMVEFVFYTVLFVNMIIKMLYEESLWHCDGDEYKQYTKHTKRLIPYIF
jgi:protein-S-isoprenylcysteine O-methyltransferase Ste14